MNDIMGYTETELHHLTISAEGRVKMRNEANRIKYGMVNPWVDCIGLHPQSASDSSVLLLSVDSASPAFSVYFMYVGVLP